MIRAESTKRLLRSGLWAVACVLPAAGASASAQGGQGSIPAEPDQAASGGKGSLDGNGAQIRIVGDRIEQFHVSDMPLSAALRLLSVQSQRNIVASPNATGNVTANLFNVTLDGALSAVLTTIDCGYVTRDDVIYVYTNDELAQIAADRTPLESRVFWLNYIRAVDAETVVTPMLSDRGTITKSGEADTGLVINQQDTGGDSFAGNEMLVVRDHADNLDRIAEVIKQIDLRPKQVLIEATILRARLTDDNALGVDFSLVAGVDLELLGSRSVGIENLTFGELPQSRFERFNANFSTRFVDDVPDGGLTFGILKDNVAVFVRALEQITDTSVLANPKVLTLNKQAGNVIVGRRDGYITTTVTETQAVQKVEFLETGTQLTFRPFVGTDGYVRVELHPEDSVGGLTAAQLPFEQTTEVTTNVLVHDGHTILIGGLFREVTSESRSQLPLLGDIPRLGDLFRARNDSLDREEVIILLTVRIVKDDQAYADQSLKTLRDLERARASLRKGMMWHGRERLAQAFYAQALRDLADGDVDRAEFNVQMALHNHPRFMAAVSLKDRLARQITWEDDGSISRQFIFDLIRRDRGLRGDVFGRPGPPAIRPKPRPDAKPAPPPHAKHTATTDGPHGR